jgi:hypothetical protein
VAELQPFFGGGLGSSVANLPPLTLWKSTAMEDRSLPYLNYQLQTCNYSVTYIVLYRLMQVDEDKSGEVGEGRSEMMNGECKIADWRWEAF